MELLLDTSILIDVLRGRNARHELLAEMVRAGHSLATTSLNVAEVYAGMREHEAPATNNFLGDLICHNLTRTTGEMAGKLKQHWSQRGRTLSLPDAIVAAIALDRGCTLLTDNRKDFPMPELTLYPLP